MTTRLWTVAIVLGLAACGKSSSTETPRPLTEYDFAADPTLSLQPGQVGVTFLEAVGEEPGQDEALTDTGGFGVDIIPFVIFEAETRTYALAASDTTGTIAKIEIEDASGVVLATLTPGCPDRDRGPRAG